MSKPSILPSLYVKLTESGEFGVFSTAKIARDSTIEFCAWLPVTQRLQILISRNDTALNSKLFQNPDGIEKEKEFINKLTELDLQERLDRGLITTAQFRSMLLDTANPEKLLHVTTHSILLGFGSIYRRSDSPNINWTYDSTLKLYKFFTVQDIYPNQELTYFSN
jgi:hypothetical protein